MVLGSSMMVQLRWLPLAALMVIFLELAFTAPGLAQSKDLKPILDRLQRIERDIMKEIDFSKFGDIETVELTRIQKISGPTLHRNSLSMPH
mgnify:CR=1 FL=1